MSFTLAIKQGPTTEHFGSPSYELNFYLTPPVAFPAFLEQPANVVVGFFRSVVKHLDDSKIEDFHLQFTNEPHRFLIQVFYGQQHEPPVFRQTCISCDIENAVSKLSLVRVTSRNRLWIDAKLRPMYVVTPLRHVERLQDLSDDELHAFFAESSTMLSEEFANARLRKMMHNAQLNGSSSSNPNAQPIPLTPVTPSPPPSAAPSKHSHHFHFKMAFNQGNYRNLAHLHLKIDVRPDDFMDIVQAWTGDRRAAMVRLAQIIVDKKLFNALIGGNYQKTVARVQELATHLNFPLQLTSSS